MNERIKELAEQAKDYADYYSMLSDSAEQEIFTEKFAELIVKECAEIAKKVDGDESDDYQSGRTWAGIDVLEHFGVKE